jgi:D-aminoacyl-tRNA deacylase
MLGILISREDSASVHIGEQLRAIADWERREDDSRPDSEGGGTVYERPGVELREFDDLHLHLERPAEAFDGPDLLAVASKHSGETGPLLTAHYTGNFGPADHGGEDYAVSAVCPNAHAHVLDALAEHAPDGYEVGMECTHHGPTEVGAPSMFVEVGSAEAEWQDPDAARAVARAILDLRGVAPHRAPENGGDWTRRQLVGLGGGHYAPRFERVIDETDWAIGHIAADWGLDAMGDIDDPASQRVLRAAIEESRAKYVLVEGDRPEAEQALADLDCRVVSETWVRETAGVDLGFVRQVEQAVLSVKDGLRFGERATDPPADFCVIDLPAALLDEARGIDREETYAALAETALAFGTDQGGTRPTGPVVLADESERERVVEQLLAILEQRYDSVERNGDSAIARKSTFVPDRARSLGVPEGPAFGRLADGQAVEVDGETIPPEVVRQEEKTEFSLTE